MDLFSWSLQWSVWSISLRPGQTEGVESVTAVSSFPRAIGQFHIKKSRDDCVQPESMRERDTVNGTFTKAEGNRCLCDSDSNDGNYKHKQPAVYIVPANTSV